MYKREDFFRMFWNNNRKALNHFCQYLFDNPDETMEFFLAIVTFLDIKKRGDVSGRCYNLASEYSDKARSRFSQLEEDKMSKVISFYHRYFEKQKENGKAGAFDISLLLGGAKLGEINHSKRVITKLVKIILTNPVPDTKDNIKVRKTFEAVSFLLSLIAYTNITYTWENFLNLALRDGDARKVLVDILRLLLKYGYQGYEVISAERWNPTRDLTIGWPPRALEALGFINNQVINLPVPEIAVGLVKDIIEQLRQELEDRQKELILLALWFADNRQKFDEIFSKMWQEIKTNPKHGLRPDGKDLVKIDISGMKTFGYTNLQFFNEGLKFPETEVKYWLKENDLIYSLTLRLDPEKTRLVDNFLKEELGPNHIISLMDQLLAFIALNCYWRIVMAQKGMPFSEDPWQKQATGKAKAERLSHALATIVRPHFRHLPIGFNASQRAIDRSLGVFKMEPPNGWTFVKKHDRGYIESETIIPLFAYSEKDIGLV